MSYTGEQLAQRISDAQSVFCKLTKGIIPNTGDGLAFNGIWKLTNSKPDALVSAVSEWSRQ